VRGNPEWVQLGPGGLHGFATGTGRSSQAKGTFSPDPPRVPPGDHGPGEDGQGVTHAAGVAISVSRQPQKPAVRRSRSLPISFRLDRSD
jgi:hypothetical protein